MPDYFCVLWSEKIDKQLKGLPKNIFDKFHTWVNAIKHNGLIKVKRLPGYHDEPLQGNRFGQRSIRLNRSYRVIYLKHDNYIEIIEVNKHEY